MHTRPRTSIVAVVAAVGLLLGGCGGSSVTDPQAAGQTATDVQGAQTDATTTGTEVATNPGTGAAAGAGTTTTTTTTGTGAAQPGTAAAAPGSAAAAPGTSKGPAKGA